MLSDSPGALRSLQGALVAMVAAACLPAPGNASENRITAYLVDRQLAEDVVGSADQDLLARILRANRSQEPHLRAAFEAFADFKEIQKTTPRAALEELIAGELKEDHGLLYHLLSEWILRATATQLDDHTPDKSLERFIDLWLEGPDRMIELLGWEELHGKWLVSSSPWCLDEVFDWPVVTTIDYDEARKIVEESQRTPAKNLLDFPAGSFEGRGDELDLPQLRRIHLQVVQELLRWTELVGPEQLLVILIDGDQ